MSRDVSNSEDILDPRDVQERIDELEGERSDLEDALDSAESALAAAAGEDNEADLQSDRDDAAMALKDWDDLNGVELKDLQDFAADYGSAEAPLVRDSHFQEYAQQLAEDIGAIDPRASWPLNCIDWEQATRELQMDYSSAEFDGVTYWYHS